MTNWAYLFVVILSWVVSASVNRTRSLSFRFGFATVHAIFCVMVWREFGPVALAAVLALVCLIGWHQRRQERMLTRAKSLSPLNLSN
jgi:hypothetical protein